MKYAGRKMGETHNNLHHRAMTSSSAASRLGLGIRTASSSIASEIVEARGHILRATDQKDRHSKVYTAKGPRDHRVRLSAHTAIQFYDVQDRLEYDRPSKAVDWVIKKAKAAIDELLPWNPNSISVQTTSSPTVPISATQNASLHFSMVEAPSSLSANQRGAMVGSSEVAKLVNQNSSNFLQVRMVWRPKLLIFGLQLLLIEIWLEAKVVCQTDEVAGEDGVEVVLHVGNDREDGRVGLEL